MECILKMSTSLEFFKISYKGLTFVHNEKKKSEDNKEELKHIETLLDKNLDLASLLRVEEYDDALVRRLVSTIKVNIDESVEIKFKVGMTVEEKM